MSMINNLSISELCLPDSRMSYSSKTGPNGSVICEDNVVTDVLSQESLERRVRPSHQLIILRVECSLRHLVVTDNDHRCRPEPYREYGSVFLVQTIYCYELIYFCFVENFLI